MTLPDWEDIADNTVERNHNISNLPEDGWRLTQTACQQIPTGNFSLRLPASQGGTEYTFPGENLIESTESFSAPETPAKGELSKIL